MSARLEDRDENVRRAAVEALANVAEEGDQHAITAVSARLEDEDAVVRRAAVKSLASIALDGDQHSMLQ